MPTKGQEGHDMGKPEGVVAHPAPKVDDQHPGYETQDVNTGGVMTFLAGLFGFVLIFFVFCFFMGKALNYALLKQDGPPNKWQPNLSQVGQTPTGDKRQNLASTTEQEQKQLQAMTQTFPTPRLESDDGNQDTADLHAREDLLLDHYSSSPTMPAGTVRIPISRAMELIVQRGLGAPAVSAPAAGTASALAPGAATPTTTASTKPAKPMAGDNAPVIQAPLTDGFARTGYELETIEARQQKVDYEHATGKKD